MTKKMTTEEFIRKAREVHGDKYDYSKTEYINAKTKVCIICPIHGEFPQSPDKHLMGRGCPTCGGSKKSTTEEFIAKAREVHGNKYDYSKVEYERWDKKVIIICPKHGEFQITPNAHLNGQGCRKCSQPKANMTTEEFIAKAREVHGNKYDYSKVEYKGGKIKVCIICPKHGEFWQTPNNHLMGKGCNKCRKTHKMDNVEFIEKAKKIYGDKYDYSKVEYVNSTTEVCIICPEHGEFRVTPNRHLQGQECKSCLLEKERKNKEVEFIEKAKKIHNNKYDYSKVCYKGYDQKVIIICPKHGEFEQTPTSHLQGQGCSKCIGKNKTTEEFINELNEKYKNKNYDYTQVNYVNATTLVNIICPEHGEFSLTPNALLSKKRLNACPKCTSANANMTTEEFIKRARLKHGDKYDYSKVVYKDTKTKVCIICPKHGEFEQLPTLHLNGIGCHVCEHLNTSTTLENFITKAREVHGDKYDYSKVKYIDNNTEVCIICHEKDEYGREHGKFWQTPYNHLSGKGCKKCSKKYRLSLSEFIETARLRHGNKYNYSKVNWDNVSNIGQDLITIICPEHGEFPQTPKAHLRGQGCPNCQGLRKQYKFNLLEEFESEYAFRAFLANNDINILTLILQNIEPKYEPIKKDIQRVLVHANETDPIQSLREKYSSETVDSDDIELIEITDTHIDDTLDWDNDDIVNDMISQESDTTNDSDNDLSMSDIIRNDEEEIKVINRLDDEHLITPEVREYIMAKYLNDRRRAWMANRDNK